MRSRSRRANFWGGLVGAAVHSLLISGLMLGQAGYAAAASTTQAASADDEAKTDAESEAAPATAEELHKLVGPVALYPDELLAVVLPGSTYPLQIVQASRFLEKHEKDPDLQPDEEWDASILALLNYPDALKLMNDDLNWTWKLGEAVANQQEDVMEAVQVFRGKVDKAGNLASNENVKIVKETEDNQQIIVIESTSTEVIYVPTYQPATVVVYQPAPYPYHYSAPCPYYYHSSAVFWTGLFVGAAVAFGIGWGRYGRYGRGGSINVNRNVNINVNNNRGGGGLGGGQGQSWKADKGRGQQSGARPGGDRAKASNSGGRAKGGAATTGGSRGQSGASNRSTGASTSNRSKGQASSGSRSSASNRSQRSGSSASRSSSSRGRDMTTSSGSRSRSSGGSSLGSYSSRSSSRSSSARGSSSRSGGRSSGRGGGRGGGRR